MTGTASGLPVRSSSRAVSGSERRVGISTRICSLRRNRRSAVGASLFAGRRAAADEQGADRVGRRGMVRRAVSRDGIDAGPRARRRAARSRRRRAAATASRRRRNVRPPRGTVTRAAADGRVRRRRQRHGGVEAVVPAVADRRDAAELADDPHRRGRRVARLPSGGHLQTQRHVARITRRAARSPLPRRAPRPRGRSARAGDAAAAAVDRSRSSPPASPRGTRGARAPARPGRFTRTVIGWNLPSSLPVE